MSLHVKQMGLEQKYFDYSVKDQGDRLNRKMILTISPKINLFVQAQALQLFSELWLYIPSENACDAQSKYSVQKTMSKVITGNSKHKRATWFYQCQCGVDHKTGRFAVRLRQVPWRNVSCLSWIKLITFMTQKMVFIMFWSEISLKKAHPSLGEHLRSFSLTLGFPDHEGNLSRYMALPILRCMPNLIHLGAFASQVSIWDVQDYDYHNTDYIRFHWEGFWALAVTAGPHLLTITRMVIDNFRLRKGLETHSPVILSHFSSLCCLQGCINICFRVNKTKISPDWLSNLVNLQLSDFHPSCFEVLT